MTAIPAVPMPLSVHDWLLACRSNQDAPAALAEACRARHCALAACAVSSGRSALLLALRALRRLRPQRTTVIVPAYTCPSVGRAVQAAGLRGLCADVSLLDFGLCRSSLETLLDGTVLAVVAPHMFGTACDAQALRRLCDRHGAALIEDLAQCFGARCHGHAVGTFGHLAFTSLGRGKNLRGHKGGVLWVNDPELVQVVGEQVEDLPPAPKGPDPRQLTQLAIMLLSRPAAWNVARRMPFLHVGAEDQGPCEAPARLWPWQAMLGTISLQRVDHYNALRREMAARVLPQLMAMGGIHPQTPTSGCESTYLRLALVVDGPEGRRDRLVERLQAAGIDARAFYTRVMHEYDWWQRHPRQPQCPNALTLQQTNLVLPMHYDAAGPSAEPVVQALRWAG